MEFLHYRKEDFLRRKRNVLCSEFVVVCREGEERNGRAPRTPDRFFALVPKGKRHKMKRNRNHDSCFCWFKVWKIFILRTHVGVRNNISLSASFSDAFNRSAAEWAYKFPRRSLSRRFDSLRFYFRRALGRPVHRYSWRELKEFPLLNRWTSTLASIYYALLLNA